MKSIFELEDGKTYKVYKNNRPLHRQFRIKNGKLENDGMGHFVPCDWVPLNAETKFEETSNSKIGIISSTFSFIVKTLNPLTYFKGVSFIKLQEGIVYKSTNPLLPKMIIRVDNRIFDYDSKAEINLEKLSLKKTFKAVQVADPNQLALFK